MYSPNYVSVIEAFCECIEKPDEAKTLLEMEQVVVDDVVFSLSVVGAEPTETLILYCDFGEIPEDAATNVYENMLEMNAYLFHGPNSPCLALSPETGRAMFMANLSLNELTGESLRDCLFYFASVAQDWRARDWHAEAAARTQMRLLAGEMGRNV